MYLILNVRQESQRWFLKAFSLPFKHRMSEVSFVLQEGEAENDLDNLINQPDRCQVFRNDLLKALH